MNAYRSALLAVLLTLPATIGAMSFPSLYSNDPYPVANTHYPYDFLHNSTQYCCGPTEDDDDDYLTEPTHTCGCGCQRQCNPCIRGRLTITPFWQNATMGTSIGCENDVPSCGSALTDPAGACDNGTNLGDLQGRWNVFGLFYSYPNEPTVHVFNPADTYTNVQLYLGDVFIKDPFRIYTAPSTIYRLINPAPATPLFTGQTIKGTDTAATTTLTDLFNTIVDPKYTDPSEAFGYLTIPIKYYKYGIRGQFFVDLFSHVGLIVQGGLCNIKQKPAITDLTCGSEQPDCPPFMKASGETFVAIDEHDFTDYKENVQAFLTSPARLDMLAQTFNLNLACYNKSGLEDTIATFLIHGDFDCNKHSRFAELPDLTFSPFAALQVNIPTGIESNVRELFSLPTSNNGHWGYGADVGFSIDFKESVEFGADFGAYVYKAKTYFNMPVPTQAAQQGLYPNSADICINPGSEWTAGVAMNAYHLIQNLSLYWAYRGIFHGKDKYDVKAVYKGINRETYTDENLRLAFTDPASTGVVLTGKMHNQSCWYSNLLFLGLDYDICRCVSLGLSVQVPLRRCNAYRVSTVYGSVGFIF